MKQRYGGFGKQNKKRRTLLISACLLAVCVLLFVASSLNFLNLSFLQVIPQYTVVPIKRFIDNTSSAFHALFTDTTELERQIIELQRQIDVLKLENADASELKLENERLRSLLGFAQKQNEEYLGADVIALTPGNWFSSFTVNKGSRDGIKENMAVITADGLVGRITKVGPYSSSVTAIIDSTSAVAGMVERTRDHAVAKGMLDTSSAQEGLLRMDYLQAETELVLGDKIFTSGLEGIYPKGILIGTVKESSRTAGQEIGTVTIQPAVDFLRLEEVLIVMSVQGETP